MTYDEIAAYVMALSVEDLRRLTATEIMGWVYTPERRAPNGELTTLAGWRLSDDASFRGRTFIERDWRPDIDRNQSRLVTDKVPENALIELLIYQLTHADEPGIYWWKRTPDNESRAALIAHMIHKETTNETDRDSYRS